MASLAQLGAAPARYIPGNGPRAARGTAAAMLLYHEKQVIAHSCPPALCMRRAHSQPGPSAPPSAATACCADRGVCPAQVAALCGVHTLNTLLQGPYFSEVDLAQVGGRGRELS